jgi:hypothetical protein
VVVQVATRWNSCAHPIPATPDRPVCPRRARYGFIASIFRSPLANLIIGIWLVSANDRTDRRNWSPIRPTTTGDGIGNPRSARNWTTWPPTCRFGT